MVFAAQQHAILACLSIYAFVIAAGEGGTCVILPEEARIRHSGDIKDDGAFSFWTNGIIGDWFANPGENKVKVSILASGRTVQGVSPLMAVEIITPDGEAQEVGRFSVVSNQYSEYSLEIPVRGEFFGIQLRHLNREADDNELRHLLLKELRVTGAERSKYGLTEFVLFGSRKPTAPTPPDTIRIIETKHLRVEIDPVSAAWSVEHNESGCRLTDVRPIFAIRDLPVDLDECEVEYSEKHVSDHKLGDFTEVEMRYQKEKALKITYTLLISNESHDIIVKADMANNTGSELVINKVAPMSAQQVTLRDSPSHWTAIGDGKRYSEPYESVIVADADEFECWWYLAVKNQKTKRSILMGSLTNMKGIGRFILLPAENASMKIAAYSDYEGIVMPAGERISGEQMLLTFGEKGTDGLEHFGELVAKAHGIDLMKDHPIDPYSPESLNLFNTWNGYGAGVVKGFDYRHDRSKYEEAYMDREWTSANWRKLSELGLDDYGYAAQTKIRIRGTPSPLARRYGTPDFWFKDAQQIAEEHPEYYIDGHIDFSNPAVVEFERDRAERAFQDKTSIIHYGWDFTDRWRRLPGQHNPFMTSAETYRSAMGIWRELARKHPLGAYAYIYMNVVGFNYDICDVLRAGQDSDQAYYGSGCTFTQGLVRQISGRYFYNGKVWWNNPDSFHVYVGGLYSYNQGVVHASFCAISGNVIYLAEPFTDQETPEDRLDIIRRVTPTTADVARAADVFEHNPARLWNMPVKRDFGEWNVVGLFNVDYDEDGELITQRIAFEDLDLSPDREYLVYEFWSKQFLGVKKGSFTRTLEAPDCEIYSIVERADHPVLISTSRHVRQMAYDIMDLKWDQAARTLSGVSRVVGGDPYQLRIFVPEGYAFADAESGSLDVDAKIDDQFLSIDFKSPVNADMAWTVTFK